jgi:replication factor C subunit 1
VPAIKKEDPFNAWKTKKQHGQLHYRGGEKVVGTLVVKDEVEVATGPLKGKTFVITGVLSNFDRDELAELLKSYGARVTGSVSRKTSTLIHGERLEDGRLFTTGNKYKKAVELGTQIIDERKLDALLLEIRGEPMPRKLDPLLDPKLDLKPELKGDSKPESKGDPKPDDKADQAAVKEHKPVVSQPQMPWKYISTQLWTDKYKPVNFRELVGNNQAVEKLVRWLRDWDDVILRGRKKEFNPCRKGRFDTQLNVNARAVLISGPPGVGKTTAARMVAAGLGYRAIEMNASDIRSRKAVLEPLKSATDNTALKNSGGMVRSVLIMDEVDGMSAGDRGGIWALSEVIKKSKVAVICICNDRMSQKIKGLAANCYDIRFSKPNKAAISKRMLDILEKERIRVEPTALDHIIDSSGNDVRQVLTMVEMWARSHSGLSLLDAKVGMKSSCKDQAVMITSFDASSKLLNTQEIHALRHRQRMDLFFVDFDFIPLLVQENYLTAMTLDRHTVDRLTRAADSIAFSDLINRKLRVDGEWNLLAQYGQAACIEPGLLTGNGVPVPRFPEFLGKFSVQRKHERMLREVRYCISLRTNCDNESVLNDYIPILYELIMIPLKAGNVQEAVEVMHAYNLTPEHFKEHFIELRFGSITYEKELKDLPIVVKSRMSKVYNELYKSSLKKQKKVFEGRINDKFDPDIDEEEEEVQEQEEEEGKPGLEATAKRKRAK